jgi:hypothetical protein
MLSRGWCLPRWACRQDSGLDAIAAVAILPRLYLKTNSTHRISADAERRATMRKGLGVLALLASTALMISGNGLKAQSPTNTNFVTGYTPQNIVFKPMNMAPNVAPMNFQQAVAPHATGPKVFNVSSVFSALQIPSTTPTRITGQSIIRPGPNTPRFAKMTKKGS